MRVQVVDRRVYAVHRHLHATYCAFTRRSNHVCAIGCCAIADDFRIDMRAARQSVLQLFDNNHTATARDDKPITVRIIGTGRFFRRIVIFGGQCAHRVELTGHFPAQLFAAASKNDVLFAQLDLFNRIADTVCGGRASGANGVVHAINFKRRSEAGGNAGCHCFRHHIRAHGFQTTRATHGVCAKDLEFRGAAAGTCNQADTRVILIDFRRQTGVGHCLLHRQISIDGGVAHKAHDFAVNEASGIQFYVAPYLATHAGVLQLLRESDP